MNTNFRAYFSHFRGPIIAILAVVIIFGLILGVYLVGKSGREEEQTQTPPETTEVSEPASEPTAQEQPAPAAETPTTSNQTQTPSPTSAVPSTGPSEIINTGPGDYTFIVFALSLAIWQYIRSKKSLQSSLL